MEIFHLEKFNLLHITDIDNLDSIFKSKGLFCQNKLNQYYRSIAHEKVQIKRANKDVLLPPGGTLHDYVPFYFAECSPMLYAIYKKNVGIYDGCQERIVYIVSSLAKVEEFNLDYIFTDGHAIMDLSGFYNKKEDLQNIDWDIMKEIFWQNTAEDGDRVRRRQAEFLVYNFFPLKAIIGFGVCNDNMKTMVENIVKSFNEDDFLIKIKENWYF